VNEAFNPYREWLGLDSHIDAPNYYELLAVPLFEADTARLLAAADRALVRVRGHRPGAQAAAWARLLDELAAAKRCLCDAQQKAAYDQSLRTGGGGSADRPRSTADRAPEIAAVNLSPDLFPPGMAPKAESAPGRVPPAPLVGSLIPPSTPGAAAGPAESPDRPVDRVVKRSSPGNPLSPLAPVHNPVPPTMGAAGTFKSKHGGGHSLPPGQPPHAGDAPALQGGEESPERDTVHTPVPPGPVNAHVAPPRKEPVSLLPMAAIVTSVVVVITVIILVIALHDEKGGSPLVPMRPVPQPATDTQSPKLGPFQPPVSNAVPVPSGSSRPVSAPFSKTASTMPSGSPPLIAGPMGGVQPAVGANSAQPAARGTSPSIPVTRPSDTSSPVTAPPSVTVADNASSGSGTDPSDSAPSTENDDPSATDDDATVPMVTDAEVAATPGQVAATPEELQQLGQLLGRARVALSQHEFVEAGRLIEQASKFAKSDEHVALVDRLQMLADLAEKFWSGVATATRQLQATQEIKVGSGDLIVVVVETGPDWLTIRNQGRNTRYLVAEMPPGLALAIARQSMNEDDPQTQLMFGAGLATVKDLKPAHLEEARRYWERAAAAGADAAPLQTVLTDTYELSK
jgi:hypothetical protein